MRKEKKLSQNDSTLQIHEMLDSAFRDLFDQGILDQEYYARFQQINFEMLEDGLEDISMPVELNKNIIQFSKLSGKYLAEKE